MKAGWETVKLIEVAHLSGRIGWKGLSAKEYTKEGPYFLSVHSLNHGDFVDFEEAFHISQARYDESPEIMLQSNDVLLCKDGAGIGKVGIIGELPGQTTINSSLLLVRSKPKIEPKYLYYILMSPYFQAIVQSRLEGATTPHLYQRDLASFPIHLPPIPEQQRIVAVLDKAFESIATAAAIAQKNLTNARALFESYLQAAFTEGGEGWVEKRLEEICGLQNGFAFQSSTFKDSGVPVLRISNIQNDAIEARRLVYIDPDDYRENLNKFKVGKGALLIAMSGATTGKVGLLDGDQDYYLNQRVGKFEPTARLNKHYLFYFLITKVEENLSISAGSAQPNLSTAQIKEFLVPLPPIGQQISMVEKFAKTRVGCERLKSIAEQKLASLTELKQSLLQKAFAGELT